MTDKRNLLFDSRVILRQLLLCFVAGCLCLSHSFTLTDVEELRNTTCYQVYKSTLGNNTKLDFALPIGGLGCPTGSYYHCLPLTNDRNKYIQFCSDWIWIEPGKCPAIYPVQQAIHPHDCNRDAPGCPRELYKSNNYYLYEQCLSDPNDKQQYEELDTTTRASTEAGSNMTYAKENTQTKERNKDFPWYILPIIVIAIVLVFAALGVLLYRKKRRNSENKNDANEGEEGEMQQVENRSVESDVANSESSEEDIHFLDAIEEAPNKINIATTEGSIWNPVTYLRRWINDH